MQGRKGTLHNGRKNNKHQHRHRNENHVLLPLGEGSEQRDDAHESCCCSRLLVLIFSACRAAIGSQAPGVVLCNGRRLQAAGLCFPSHRCEGGCGEGGRTVDWGLERYQLGLGGSWGAPPGALLVHSPPTLPALCPCEGFGVRGLRWGSPTRRCPSLRHRLGSGPGGVGWPQQRLQFSRPQGILHHFVLGNGNKSLQRASELPVAGGCSWGSADPVSPWRGMCPQIPKDAAAGEHSPAGRAFAPASPHTAKIRTWLIAPVLIPAFQAPSAQTSRVRTPNEHRPLEGRGGKASPCANTAQLGPIPPLDKQPQRLGRRRSANERQPGATQPVPASSRCHQK